MNNRILLHAFGKNKKYYRLMMMSILISVFFIGSVYAFYETMLAVNYGKDIFGHQQAIVYCLSDEQIKRICSDERIKQTVCFYRTVLTEKNDEDAQNNIALNSEFNEEDDAYSQIMTQSQEPNITFYIDCINEDFFDFTEYELVSGRMPKSDSEILCQSSYLIKIGIPAEKMLGAIIALPDKSYTVTGIYTMHRLWSDYELPEYQFFTGHPKTYNSVAISTKDLDVCRSLSETENFENVHLEYNHSLWIIRSNRQQVHKLCIATFIMIILTVLIIFSHCISMFLHEQRRNIGVFRLTGISAVKLTVAVYLHICKIMLISCIIDIVMLFGMVRMIIKYYYKLFPNSYFSTDFSQIQPLSYFWIPLAVCCIYLLGAFGIVWHHVYRMGYFSVKKSHNIRIRKNKLSEELSDSFIAKRHIKVARIANLFSNLCICFVFLAFTIVNIYFSSQSVPVSFLKDYDYIAYIDNWMLLPNNQDEADEFLRSISEMQEDGITVEPHYSYKLSFYLPKRALSDQYLSFLSSDSQASYQINNPYSTEICVPIFLVAFTDEEWTAVCEAMHCSPYALTDGYVEAFSNIVNYKDGRIPGIDYKHMESIEFSENYAVHINNVYEYYPLETTFIGEGTLLAMNMNTFRKIVDSPVPTDIGFYVSPEKEAIVTALFSGVTFITLTNMSELRSNQKIIAADHTLYIIIFIVMLSFSLFNILVIVMMRSFYNSHEYETMHIIGISPKHIANMLKFEIIYSLLPTMILSNIISPFFAYIFLMNLSVKERPSFPLGTIILCNLLLIIIGCIVYVVFKKHLRQKHWNYD